LEQIADDETATPSDRTEPVSTVAPYLHPKLTAIAPSEPGQQIALLPPLQLVVQFEVQYLCRL
jgi:hypothetical protein